MPGLVPGIHVFNTSQKKTWMAGTEPGHDSNSDRISRDGTSR